MAKRGLLSRLGSDDRNRDELSEVLEHLRVLLNTRNGDAQTVPDFGIIDFSDMVHSLPEGVHTLSQAIRQTILTFEPRLRNVVVRYVPGEDPLKLNFEIVARLASDRKRLVRLSTTVNSTGRISIQ